MQSIWSTKLYIALMAMALCAGSNVGWAYEEASPSNSGVVAESKTAIAPGTQSLLMKAEEVAKQHNLERSPASVEDNHAAGNSLMARNDRNFIKDIVDRLHALDADIGKLLYNSTSMYAPDDQASVFRENQPKGGERFTEVLADLDSLQDEIRALVNNATRTRQYNILVRLRPLNTILYRIRHNLHLMRNSLVAVNTVATLERLGNSVLDSTLQAFLQPDANASEEFGDDGNYDIDLNKPPNANETEVGAAPLPQSTTSLAPTTSITTTTTSTTTTTTTTPKPTTTTTTTSTTEKPPTTRRATRPPNRRASNRQNQRRNTTTTTTTQKPQS